MLPDWVGTLEGDGQPFAERDEAVLDEWWAGALEAERTEAVDGAAPPRPRPDLSIG